MGLSIMSECVELMEYVAALALFDGYFDIRPNKNYEVLVADMNRHFLESICAELRLCYAVACTVRRSSRDRAWRLRIYGREFVLKLHSMAQELLKNPSQTLLGAAIDAEGNITRGGDQPVRVRIVQRAGEKAEAIRLALERLGIPYSVSHRGGGRYVEFVISNKDNARTLLRSVRLRHPDKISRLSDLLT